jgi:hypothetical protein
MAVITAAAITGATITAGTVAAGVAVGGAVASAGVGVMNASNQKKAAKQAGQAFAGVGKGIEKVDKVEAGIRQLLGVKTEDAGTERDTYNILRDKGNKIVEDQMDGRLSESTRLMLGRRALDSGAVGLGPGAVDDAYTGFLGLTMEAQAQQGFSNYRAMFGQLAGVAQQQQAQNYNMQYNAAAAQASSIMGQANATAAMWSNVASGVGAIAGAYTGNMGSAAGGAMVGGGGGGYQPSQAYFNNMQAAGRSPYIGGAYLGAGPGI